MNTELINKLKQIESLTTEVLAMTQENTKEHPFIKGEHVQVRDYDSQEWMNTTFRHYNQNSDVEPYCADKFDGVGWRQCRRPVGVDNILIRWFGGECPVDIDKEVFVIPRCRSLHGRRGHAGSFVWRHDGGYGDIIAYMAINLGDK